MRDIFVDEIRTLARKDPRIVFLTAECGFSVTEGLAEEFPDRYFNVGIAEQSLVGTAAGMALRGLRPIAYNLSAFLTMRAYEQIRMDVAYQNLPVILAGIGPGLGYGQAGTTHHALEDTAIMRVLPNMTVVVPAHETDVRAAVNLAIEHDGPVYISLARPPKQLDLPYASRDFMFGKAMQMRNGNMAAVFAAGPMLPVAMEAADILQNEGIDIRVYNNHTIKPLDTEAIDSAAKDCGVLFSLEEASVVGGLGGAMAEYIAENAPCKFKRLGIPDVYPARMGDYNWLLRHFGIDGVGVAASIKEVLGR